MQNIIPSGSKITIEVLAQMIARGFKEAGQDLADFRSEVYERFDRLEGRVSNVENKVTNVEKNVTDMNKSMATKDDIAHLEDVMKNHGTRIRRIETKLQLA